MFSILKILYKKWDQIRNKIYPLICHIYSNLYEIIVLLFFSSVNVLPLLIFHVFLIYHCFRNKYSNWVWLNSQRNSFLVEFSRVRGPVIITLSLYLILLYVSTPIQGKGLICHHKLRKKKSYSLHLPQEVTIQIMKDKWLTVCNLSKINSYGLDWLQFRYDCLYADKISFILTACNNYNSYMAPTVCSYRQSALATNLISYWQSADVVNEIYPDGL